MQFATQRVGLMAGAMRLRRRRTGCGMRLAHLASKLLVNVRLPVSVHDQRGRRGLQRDESSVGSITCQGSQQI
jgi:hypothetical protein